MEAKDVTTHSVQISWITSKNKDKDGYDDYKETEIAKHLIKVVKKPETENDDEETRIIDVELPVVGENTYNIEELESATNYEISVSEAFKSGSTTGFSHRLQVETLFVCDCNIEGTKGRSIECDESKQCLCKVDEGYTGAMCSQCSEGYYDEDQNSDNTLAVCKGMDYNKHYHLDLIFFHMYMYCSYQIFFLKIG